MQRRAERRLEVVEAVADRAECGPAVERHVAEKPVWDVEAVVGGFSQGGEIIPLASVGSLASPRHPRARELASQASPASATISVNRLAVTLADAGSAAASPSVSPPKSLGSLSCDAGDADDSDFPAPGWVTTTVRVLPCRFPRRISIPTSRSAGATFISSRRRRWPSDGQRSDFATSISVAVALSAA
jgi:hypothetical protein